MLLLSVFFAILLFSDVCGKHISGILKSDSDWQFLTRFCFLPDHGSLQFNFKYPVSHLTQSMLLYWDKPNLWESVYKTDLTCKEKELKLDTLNYQIFRLEPTSSSGLCRSVGNGTQISCRSPEYRFKSQRERWWYLVISNCMARGGLLIEYEMWMRNGERGNIFREHFSADELYILEFNIVFFLLQLVLLVLAILVAFRLRKKQLFHTTYKIYLLSVSLILLSTFLCCITYINYGSTGVKSVGLYYLSAALQSAGTLSQQLLVLLLSLGYSVTCGRLPAWATALASALMTALAAGHAALFAVDAVSADPGLVQWRWSSLPGYCLIGLLLAACVAFSACAGRTLAIHGGKRSFYAPLLAGYAAWQLCLPAGPAVCAAWVPPFMRARVSTLIDLSLAFAAHLGFLLLAWPAIGNPCFPFHIKTALIDAITFEDADERAAVGMGGGIGGEADILGGGIGGGGSKLACELLPDGRPFAQFSLSQSRSFISGGGLDTAPGKHHANNAAGTATPVYEEIRDCSSSVDRYSAYSNTATSPRRPESTLGWPLHVGGGGGPPPLGVSGFAYDAENLRGGGGGGGGGSGYPSMGVSSLSYSGFPTNERRRGGGGSGSRPSLPL